MAEFPALPFFTDAYLADTRHLTTEEHGAYVLLLMCAWRTRGCQLKADDRLLARIAGVSPTRWRRLKPNLAEFFTETDGTWRQQKLSYVYETVSKKVARNRQNGARGGRVTAARRKNQHYSSGGLASPKSEKSFTAGWPIEGSSELSGPEHCAQQSFSASESLGECIAADVPSALARVTAKSAATKTKTKTKADSSKQAALLHPKQKRSACPGGSMQPEAKVFHDAALAHNSSEDRLAIAAAAGLELDCLDSSALTLWAAAGAEVKQDILPTLKQISARQRERTGNVPNHLAYYSAAVLEARDKRLGAKVKGAAYAAARPAKAPQQAFEKSNPDHWRKFLGDPKSRSRGNYLSQNWCVPRGHPDFEATLLGPDPKNSVNTAIPNEIYRLYAVGWGWRPRAKS